MISGPDYKEKLGTIVSHLYKVCSSVNSHRRIRNRISQCAAVFSVDSASHIFDWQKISKKISEKSLFYPYFKPVESLQSHMILTMSHWSSRLPVCFPSQGTQVQIPWGDICETGILLLALSRYIGDPNVIRSLASSPSRCFTRLRANNV
jgi:hypothetical protein